jgi:hypothetical protein
MHPLFWFVVILTLSVVYGMRVRAVVGHVQASLLHWWVAVAMVGSLGIGTILATRCGVQVPREAGVALHAIVLFACSWLGLRYWFPLQVWDAPAAALALVGVGMYFADRVHFNNPMLAAIALGIGVGGYYVTKRWLKVFYVLMAIADAYMVWGSSLSEELAKGETGLFPASLILGLFRLPFYEIGTMDVTMGAMAVVGIQRHRGLKRSMLFALSCIVITYALALTPEFLLLRGGRFEPPSPLVKYLVSLPFLIVLAPLVLVFLAGYQKPGSAKS